VLTFVCLFALKADNPMIQLQNRRLGRDGDFRANIWTCPRISRGGRDWGKAYQIRAVGWYNRFKGNVLDLRTSEFRTKV